MYFQDELENKPLLQFFYDLEAIKKTWCFTLLGIFVTPSLKGVLGLLDSVMSLGMRVLAMALVFVLVLALAWFLKVRLDEVCSALLHAVIAALICVFQSTAGCRAIQKHHRGARGLANS